jgi:hypothetical protein
VLDVMRAIVSVPLTLLALTVSPLMVAQAALLMVRAPNTSAQSIAKSSLAPLTICASPTIIIPARLPRLPRP